jgi:hypothetical protein
LFSLITYTLITYIIILGLWYTNNYDQLRRVMTFTFIGALLFSGGFFIRIDDFIINGSFLFVIKYYILGFILCMHYGHDEYINIIKKHFYTVLILFLMYASLFFMITSDITVMYSYNIKQIIQDMFVYRREYIVVVLICFYLGQIFYANSFNLIPRKSFWFEFLCRLPIIMTMQSILFYVLQFRLFFVDNDFQTMFITGNIVRFINLLLLFIPVYYIYQLREKRHGQIT